MDLLPKGRTTRGHGGRSILTNVWTGRGKNPPTGWGPFLDYHGPLGACWGGPKHKTGPRFPGEQKGTVFLEGGGFQEWGFGNPKKTGPTHGKPGSAGGNSHLTGSSDPGHKTPSRTFCPRARVRVFSGTRSLESRGVGGGNPRGSMS